MNESEMLEFIRNAEKVDFSEIAESDTFVGQLVCELHNMYRLYTDKNGKKKFCLVDLSEEANN